MALWTPADITTALWLDAADAGTITLNGSNVSQWDDKSGNARHFSQSTSALQPAYTTTQNSLNTVDFNEDYLQSAGASSIWKWLHDATTKYTFVGVIKPKDSDNRIIWGTNTGSSGTVGANVRRDGASGLADRALSYLVTRGGTGYRVLKYTDAHAIADNTWGIVTLDSDVANATVNNRGLITVDGQSAGDNNFSTTNYSASTSNPSETLRIGSNATNSTPFVGEMAELVFLDYEATTDTVQKTEGYLAWKWGIQAELPANHPYKNAAPLLPFTGHFHGTVRDKNGALAERRVIATLDSTGECVGTLLSDPVTGEYELETVINEPHTLIFTGEADRNALVYTGVMPEEIP